jgi:ADP-ribose pyrophosphatase
VSIVFKSRVFNVETLRRRFPSGREHDITVVRHVPSVVLLPMADDNTVVMIRQYRGSVDKMLWEIPAGSTNPGETPEACAIRECEEEIGLVPGNIERLCALYPAPGFCDELLIFFRVSDLSAPPADSDRHADDDEEIEVQRFTVAEAKAMVANGTVIDLKTAYALTLLER